MLEYFTSARKELVKAFIVYKPDNDTNTPPETNDISWNLNDGGSWQFANQFPTYAIPGPDGSVIAHQLSLYSGNVSTAPNGASLEREYDPTDYIRLWAKVTADSGTQLPSLWVFLVIVLGLLIVIIGATSLCMHLVQRRRRNTLRERVTRGEVDLEALGIKRLNVPEDYLSKLPVYTFLGESDQYEKDSSQTSTQVHKETSPNTDDDAVLKSNALSRHSSAPDAPPTTHASTVFAQTTCPICLDDFEPNESQVRELPCRHIFHVECIDPFLLNNSSLCPMCKTTVLPQGYCPTKITNAMVRRERIISNRRARDASTQYYPTGNFVARLPGAYDSLRARLGSRRIFSAPARSQPPPPDFEMTSGTPSNSGPAMAAVSPVVVAAPEPTHGSGQAVSSEPAVDHPQQRREWARQRALTLLGNQDSLADSEAEEQPRSRWKRGMHKMFPGFR